MLSSFRFEICFIVFVFALVAAFVSESSFTTFDCLLNRVSGGHTAFCNEKLRESFTFVTPKPKQELIETRASDNAAIFGARSSYLDDYIRDSRVEDLPDVVEAEEAESDTPPDELAVTVGAEPSLGSAGGLAPPASPSPYDIAAAPSVRTE